MKKYLIFAFLLIGCQTTPKPDQKPVLNDGYQPKFIQNDCVTVSPVSSLKPRSDGTPAKVIFVDLKYHGYVLYMLHPLVEGPSIFGNKIKDLDKNWVLIDCPANLR